MDFSQLTSEEVDAVRTAIPWVKIFGSGSAAAFIVALWKAFGIYRRLSDVEKTVQVLNLSGLLTREQHDAVTAHCQDNLKAEIAKEVNALHVKWLEEVSEIRETQCSILGELKQISMALDKGARR